MKRRRKTKQSTQNRNYLPTLIIAILAWIGAGLIIYFVNPEEIGAMPMFFSLLFAALFFTLSLLLANSRRGGIISIAIIFYLLLRYYNIGHILNLLLIIGVITAFEIYFAKKS